MYKKSLFITQAAIIAAIYTVLVIVFNFISFGPIQVRIAEALTILPYFTPAAIPGVTIGCLLSAILNSASVPDIIFGTLATLIAAVLSYLLRRYKYLVSIPPIVVNALIVPWILKLSYGAPDAVPFMMLTVGGGELVAAGILGMILLFALEKVRPVVFGENDKLIVNK
jgi:Predicted membrane protein